MNDQLRNNAEAATKATMFAVIASLGWVFWCVGGMEMIERLAYYGVKAVAVLYAKAPAKDGGLGITMSEFGNILMVWALVQSILPVFTGGLSDIYGYKETIAASTVVKIIGYLVMGFFPTYTGFFIGAIILATGTAIFKPGIQGTLVKTVTKESKSIGWGIFYQTVNIGGFLGPILAGQMRKMEWKYVFFACAAIISLNFIMIFLYKEPGKEDRLARAARIKQGQEAKRDLIKESLEELKKPVLWVYLILFSGFWFMFNALFDVLPAHIEDWVDSRDIVASIFGPAGGNGHWLSKIIVLSKDGMSLLPESLLNVNAGLIMITCFFFSYLSGKMRDVTSIFLGTLMATGSLFFIGQATAGWFMVFVICLFSIGEMISSPKFSEFIGAIAPSDKKAMYLGFSQIPLAIGWTLEGKIGPWLYGKYASKENISREALGEQGLLSADKIKDIPEGEAFQKLVELTGTDSFELTQQFYQSHDIATVWIIMGVVGVLSAIGIWIYGKWIIKLNESGKVDFGDAKI